MYEEEGLVVVPKCMNHSPFHIIILVLSDMDKLQPQNVAFLMENVVHIVYSK